MDKERFYDMDGGVMVEGLPAGGSAAVDGGEDAPVAAAVSAVGRKLRVNASCTRIQALAETAGSPETLFFPTDVGNIVFNGREYYGNYRIVGNIHVMEEKGIKEPSLLSTLGFEKRSELVAYFESDNAAAGRFQPSSNSVQVLGVVHAIQRADGNYSDFGVVYSLGRSVVYPGANNARTAGIYYLKMTLSGGVLSGETVQLQDWGGLIPKS